VGYCIPEDVTPLISLVGTLSDQTQLTDAGVDVLITQVSAEIDGHLRAKGYLLPVADPEALGALKATCQSGAAARILRSLFPAAEGVSGDAGSAAFHEKHYQDGLVSIDKGGLAADMVLEGGCRVSDGFPRRRHQRHYASDFGPGY